MYSLAQRRLSRLVNAGAVHLLKAGRMGLEKENLRVAPDGSIALTPHPPALGSALTHPYITTDYSEALLEFITPPLGSAPECLEFLRDAHQFVYRHLGREFLWATSMPCVLAGEQGVPIASYGDSNAGIMKTVYRRGLGHRYGRVMQVIAGVHFNHSFSDAFWEHYQDLEGDTGPLRGFRDRESFALLRNLQRCGWLVPYLFGAAPAVCRSFLAGKSARDLQPFAEGSYYAPFATSLRMGDIGYQNHQEDETGVKACYDSLEAYIASLSHAIETPCPEYEAIGVHVDGEWRQLNANLLQIENEYYSTVRPKQPPGPDEKPTHALARRGVRYIELRSLDVNAFHPLGVHEDQLRFLEVLFAFCLLHESPGIDARERAAIDRNQSTTAHRGREPGLRLQRNGDTIALREWAKELCQLFDDIAAAMDESEPDQPYTRSLARQRESVSDPDHTPSARVLAEMRRNHEDFFDFANRLSMRHRRFFNELQPNPEREAEFEAMARDSLERQRDMEAADDIPFGEYLDRYHAQRL